MISVHLGLHGGIIESSLPLHAAIIIVQDIKTYQNL